MTTTPEAEATMAEIEALGERVTQFNCLQLPGQPIGMHMGTSYLVQARSQALLGFSRAASKAAKHGRSIAKMRSDKPSTRLLKSQVVRSPHLRQLKDGQQWNIGWLMERLKERTPAFSLVASAGGHLAATFHHLRHRPPSGITKTA